MAEKTPRTWKGRDIHLDPSLDWPTWDLPSPFERYADGYTEEEWGPQPKTLAELRMYELSWVLRSKPEWQRKASDPAILSKWRKEALEQQESIDRDEQLTQKMVDYVLAELSGYARIAENEQGIERGCFDAIWYSDRLISDDLTERLKTAASALEDMPENEKDWHPGSNGQVLDLVHPSLYCVVYGRTPAYLPDKPRIPENLLIVAGPGLSHDEDKWAISEESCWMPSDFAVLADGSHQPLYRIIEDFVGAFIPMFERVLGEIDKEKNVALKESGRIHDVSCIWPDGRPDSDPEDDMDEEEWAKHRDSQKALPEANTYGGELESVLSPISLRGRTVQCIIKLANIHLTPEHPKYAGGSWHVEGMANEHIVASGIYYYDEENITESRLSFRVPTGQPTYHEQDDSECMEILYGIDKDDDCVQDIGSMVTKAGRALSWPNLFQHCVSSFELADASKPGHRKILAIFLVDPTVDPIASTTDVPPQQAEWAAEALQQAWRDPGSLVSCLPQELVDLIKERLPAMTRKEAEAYRLELMKERTAFVGTHSETAYGVKFNMCEH
ncbi:hypothetical protein B0H17DRAFT_1169438 [Mycena rosella]|uniref:Uncharacterized protein n=1 Tax=Mycena rosella TaxID=1033263 RepID=A0AAD7DDA6_MYCRO|nr:hypothetical protein B0H17DRAFT_1169438 [Mycena rosella]